MRHGGTAATQITGIQGGRAQSAKRLPSQHQDLKWLPRGHVIKLGRLAWLVVPILERKRKLGPWSLLARQPSE